MLAGEADVGKVVCTRDVLRQVVVVGTPRVEKGSMSTLAERIRSLWDPFCSDHHVFGCWECVSSTMVGGQHA